MLSTGLLPPVSSAFGSPTKELQQQLPRDIFLSRHTLRARSILPWRWIPNTDGSSNSMTDCVRRRRLVRVAIKLKSRASDPLAPAKPAQMPLGAAAVSATAVPAAPVVVAEPVGGAVAPIVVPPAASLPQQRQEAPSPAPVPDASLAGPSAGGTTLIAFLQSVRCEQYTKALVDLGASQVVDLKDMQVSIIQRPHR